MPKFVPRERKHKVRQRQERKANGRDDGLVLADSNVAEILPISISEKEQRRQDLKDQFKNQQPKISGKKQKRLDKYIVRDFLSHSS